MTGVLWAWLISPILCSFVLINELGYPPLGLWENILASIPVGFAIANWTTYLVACYLGTINEQALTYTTTLFGTIAVIGSWRGLRRIIQRRNWIIAEIKSSFPLILFLTLSLIVLWRLYDTHYLLSEGGVVKSGGTTGIELPLHLDIINSFVKGENSQLSFDRLPKSPIYAGEPLQYSFFPDFHAACLIIGGMSEREALIIPGMMLAASIMGLLYMLNLRLLRGNKRGAIIGVIVTILSGGVGILYWTFEHGLSTRALDLYDFVERVNGDRTSDLFWHPVIPNILIPQRQSLYALGLVIFILILMVECMEGRGRMEIYAIAGLCTSLLPTIQQHSFLSISFIMGVYMIFNPKDAYKPKKMAGWILFLLPIFFFAFPSAVVFLGKSAANGGDFFKVKLLWSTDFLSRLIPHASAPTLDTLRSIAIEILSPVVLWLRSLGLFVPMAVWGTIKYSQSKAHTRMLIGAWSLFIIANIFQFQSLRVENMKLFVVWMIVASSACAAFIVELTNPKRNVFVRIFGILLLLSLIISGSVSLYREFSKSSGLYGEEEMMVAKWVEENTLPNARFLTSPIHFHPISSIAGRSRFAGYPLWLLAHGYYEYEFRLEQISRMYRVGSATSTKMELKNNQIDYVVIDKGVKSWNEEYWTNNFKEVYSSAEYRIFAVSKRWR